LAITADQKTRIRDLVEQLNAHDALDAALRKRGVSSINSLTGVQAEEIAAKLWQKLCLRKADAATGPAPSQLPDDAREAQNAGPCTQAQIDLAKQLIGELEQLQPGITKRIKAKLSEAGLSKIADLCLADCERFLQQLGKRNIEEFFAASLAKPVKQEGHQGN
jgi:hypothetical protein